MTLEFKDDKEKIAFLEYIMKTWQDFSEEAYQYWQDELKGINKNDEKLDDSTPNVEIGDEDV